MWLLVFGTVLPVVGMMEAASDDEAAHQCMASTCLRWRFEKVSG